MAEDEKKVVVAYLGPASSYTHQAALSRFSAASVTLQPSSSIADIFAAVQASSAEYGVVPFENSSNGSVVFTLDLFADREGKYADILVEDEVYVSVVHCLLGRVSKPLIKEEKEEEEGTGHAEGEEKSSEGEEVPKEPSETSEMPTSIPIPEPEPELKPKPYAPITSLTADPLPDLSHLTTLYTHPQAWGQCTRFLASSPHLKTLDRQDVSSTSRAAQLVAEDKTGKSAAISSRLAAEAYGLDILREGIEDRRDNATRFLVLRRRRDGEGEGDGGIRGGNQAEEEEELVEEMVKMVEGEQTSDEAGKRVQKKRNGNVQKETERPADGRQLSGVEYDDENRNEKERDDSVYDYYRIPSSLPQPTNPALVASSASTVVSPTGAALAVSAQPSRHTAHKTLVTFTISHVDPGALAASLSVFSKHGLNLTSINTRPSGVENWNYIFFVELQGRREEYGKGEVNLALRELGSVCRGWRWLGSWENALRQ